MDRWRDLKYGLRIHWGLYSRFGTEASWPVRGMSGKEKRAYFDSYKNFNPKDFDAEKWMQLLHRGGLTNFMFTCKHHDGFSMFDTKTRVRSRVNYTAPGGPKLEACDLAYSVMDAPIRRDLVKELCDAAHEHGIAVDLYFSHIDWYDADFRMDPLHPLYDKNFNKQSHPQEYARFVQRHRQQILELLSNYGKIDMMCLDIRLPDFCWPDIKETVLLARRLQPDVLFRERGIGIYGDYTTPENWIPNAAGFGDHRVDRPWMVIYTLAGQFAYERDGKKYKPALWILSSLVDICAKGGNFQVAVGPDEHGNFHPEAVKRLEDVGNWLKVNGEAIYKTRPWTNWKEGADIRFTRSKDGKYVYAISLKWPGERLALESLRAKAGSKIFMLGVGQPLDWRNQARAGLVIEIPKALQDPAKRPCPHAWALCVEPASQQRGT